MNYIYFIQKPYQIFKEHFHINKILAMFFSKKICSKANQESTWMIWSKVTRLHQRCAGSLLLRRYLSPRTPRRPVRCWCSGTESNRQGWQRAESQTSWQVTCVMWREGLSRHLHKAERHQQHQHSGTAHRKCLFSRCSKCQKWNMLFLLLRIS